MGDSLDAVQRFPSAGRHEVGHSLYLAQMGEKHVAAKPLHGLGSGVMEVAVADRSGVYRVVYVVNLGERVYVLHAFQKKSKKGVKTPQPEIQLIRARLRRAVELEHQRS
jgi:phage-related protein